MRNEDAWEELGDLDGWAKVKDGRGIEDKLKKNCRSLQVKSVSRVKIESKFMALKMA